MTGTTAAPRLLLVGGGGGFVGRAVLSEFAQDYQIRSVHRHPVPLESTVRAEWIPADAALVQDWRPLLEDVDVVLTLAWYRAGNATRFRRLYQGLHRLVEAARAERVTRFVHLSVPAATPSLERTLPYLSYRRKLDRELQESGLSYRILRPTAIFGPGDRLLGVMLRLMRRYRWFPMFGDGEYHLSPISVGDVARALAIEARSTATGIVDLGGPVRYKYRELTDRMYAAIGKPPNYWRFSRRGSLALAQLLENLGSTVLYEYEVEWLLSDLLGLPAYTGLDRPLAPLDPYLESESRRLAGGRSA